MNGHTVCPGCLRTVRIKDGRITYHVGETWSNTACSSFRSEATWVVDRPIMALGKNVAGDCMKCWQNVSQGENPECSQCCLAKWHAND